MSKGKGSKLYWMDREGPKLMSGVYLLTIFLSCWIEIVHFLNRRLPLKELILKTDNCFKQLITGHSIFTPLPGCSHFSDHNGISTLQYIMNPPTLGDAESSFHLQSHISYFPCSVVFATTSFYEAYRIPSPDTQPILTTLTYRSMGTSQLEIWEGKVIGLIPRFEYECFHKR